MAFASVVVTGNRIIYPASASEKVVQFTNGDQAPYMVQIWTDINNPNSTVENADGPFVANPQMFRMAPNSGQAVRLIYTGKTALPTDRESVFYFNFLQIPSLKQADANKNKLALLITNRLKIFYRPDGLAGSPEKVADNLSFLLNNKTIEVANMSAYHASFTEAAIVDKNGKVLLTVPKTTMVAPKSTVSWSLPKSLKQDNLLIDYSLVNDYGVPVKHQQILN
ncbi:molecular chaperone [Utexia brackfieldae]|uniref:fimbrial biogenesis chaperone n=1 Tax=Utexia brackfieldae TaxID=3074108 RepID=UPI00370D0D1E